MSKLKKEMNSVTPLILLNIVRTEIKEHVLNDFIDYWVDKVDMIGIQEMVNPFYDDRVGS